MALRGTSAIVAGLLVALSLAALPIRAADTVSLELTKTEMSKLIERTLKERGIPSASIVLIKGDAIVWKAAFGYANLRTRTPATPETIYSTGSTFKSVTATAVMQLAEQGKLRVTDPVNNYLGDVQIMDQLQAKQPVTFEHLLTHRSGLNSIGQLRPIWGREQPRTLRGLASDLYSVRPPELQYEYNNGAYALAGFAVEKITGMEYERYMIEHVLKPLGVKTPHPVQPSPEMVELMALPYKQGDAGQPPQPTVQVHYDVYPAGDIYLTAEDMGRYLGAHLNGGVFNGNRILSAESVKEMHRPRFGGAHGFGFEIFKDAQGHTLIRHGGAIPGQNSVLLGDVDARVGVYIMTNLGGTPTLAGAPPTMLAEAALRLLSGERYEPLTSAH